MKLDDALTEIGLYLGVDANLLRDYAAQDQIGGFHLDMNLRKWTTGSMWEVEAQFIYALIRALQPERVLEIGVGNGCTTTHILSALDENVNGWLTSLDPHPYNWENVPTFLRDRWDYHPQDAVTWLREHPDEHFDIVIEDGPHDYDFTYQVLVEARKTEPRLVIAHDAAHSLVGADVSSAFQNALGDIRIVLIQPSDCGLAWRIFDD